MTLSTADWLLVKVLCPTRHKIGYSGDVPQANRSAWHGKNKTQHNKSTHSPMIRTTTQNKHKLESGPMANVMVALPNIGGALCSTTQSLADAHYQNAIQ